MRWKILRRPPRAPRQRDSIGGEAVANQTITAQEVFRLRQSGQPARLIDVRTPAEFAAIHAEDARSVPLDRLDPPAVMAATGLSYLAVLTAIGSVVLARVLVAGETLG